MRFIMGLLVVSEDLRGTKGTDGHSRCGWSTVTPDYQAYHDAEWGYPVVDDVRLFEQLSLEMFQAGLNWRTILTKREHFRRAFADFDFNVLADFGPTDVERLLQDTGIVRHRGKITAVIQNARCAQALVAEAGSLATFVWRFAPQCVSSGKSANQSSESVALAKALRQRGWVFIGPVVTYSFMQAMGLVNDHAPDCFAWQRVAAAQAVFKKPV